MDVEVQQSLLGEEIIQVGAFGLASLIIRVDTKVQFYVIYETIGSPIRQFMRRIRVDHFGSVTDCLVNATRKALVWSCSIVFVQF